MPKPLTITSTTNAHALAVYGALTCLGGYCTFTAAPPALLAYAPMNVATVLMGLMMLSGTAAFSASLISARRRDPTMGMFVEIIALVVIAITLSVLLAALISFYGQTVPSSVVFVGATLVGCVGRAVQAYRERRLLTRARHQRNRRTVEVTAEPDRM